MDKTNNYHGGDAIMKLRSTTKTVLHAFSSGFAIGAASIASAQDAQQPPKAGPEVRDRIVVTATKREASLQDVPFSINAQTEEDIQRSGAVTLEDLSRNVAGLAIQNLGPGQSQISIRGVSSGQIVRDQPGVKEQVGVYLDETAISMSLFTPDIDLFDLKRVETLRGPQGTLFGAGNIGDQYAVTGAQTMGNKNMAFIGTAGVAGMAGYQSLVDGAFMYGATNNGGNTAYFPQSLRVLTMLMMSGNFVDFSKPR